MARFLACLPPHQAQCQPKQQPTWGQEMEWEPHKILKGLSCHLHISTFITRLKSRGPREKKKNKAIQVLASSCPAQVLGTGTDNVTSWVLKTIPDLHVLSHCDNFLCATDSFHFVKTYISLLIQIHLWKLKILYICCAEKKVCVFSNTAFQK